MNIRSSSLQRAVTPITSSLSTYENNNTYLKYFKNKSQENQGEFCIWVPAVEVAPRLMN